MPGGWTMSMAWMRMPGQTWPGAAASFMGMWVVMMVAMMLPSLIPMLRRYREAVTGAGRSARSARLTALVAAGYFVVWTALGMAAFPIGVALATVEMRQPALARAVPIAVGLVVLVAGFLQLTAVEGASPRLLPRRAGPRPPAAGRHRHGAAPRRAPRRPVQPLLRRLDGDSPRRRRHGPSRDGRRRRRRSPSNARPRRCAHRARAVGAVAVVARSGRWSARAGRLSVVRRRPGLSGSTIWAEVAAVRNEYFGSPAPSLRLAGAYQGIAAQSRTHVSRPTCSVVAAWCPRRRVAGTCRDRLPGTGPVLLGRGEPGSAGAFPAARPARLAAARRERRRPARRERRRPARRGPS